MGFERNTLTDAEWNSRFNSLMPGLIATGKATNKSELKELFFLYNDRFTPRHTKSGCGKCISRVFNKMKEHFKSLPASSG